MTGGMDMVWRLLDAGSGLFFQAFAGCALMGWPETALGCLLVAWLLGAPSLFRRSLR